MPKKYQKLELELVGVKSQIVENEEKKVKLKQ